jgi:hypothetical protein
MIKKTVLFSVCIIFLRGFASAAVVVNDFTGLKNAVNGANPADVEITADFLQFNSDLFLIPANSAGFTFKSASLSGKTALSGAGLYSGFSFQNHSSVSFENISFASMNSYANGAAFYLLGSSASFSGETSFYLNNSQNMGGAFEISGSTALFIGAVGITSNSARYSGGGFLASAGSSLEFRDFVKMSANSSMSGGAFRSDASSVIFSSSSESVFENNAASYAGGVFAALNSRVIFDGKAEFSNNSSSQYGGAGYFESSTGVFTNAKFHSNSAGAAGGALYAGNSYLLIKSTGGQTSVFDANTAGGRANSISLENSAAVFLAEASGAIELRDGLTASENSAVFFSGEGTFELYGDMSGNRGDLTVSASNGGSFNVNSGGVLSAKTLTNAAGSQISAANNGQNDVISAQKLNNEGTLSLDLGDKIKVKGGVKLDGGLDIYAGLANASFRKTAYKIINYGGTLESSAASVNVISGASFSSPAVLDYGGYFSKWITLVLYGDLEKTGFSFIDDLSYNQTQTARTFDALSKDSSGDLDAVISYMEGLDESAVKEALYETGGFFIANAVRGSSLFRVKNILFGRIQRPLSESKNGKTWVSAGFSDFTVFADGKIPGDYNDSSSQITAGYDVCSGKGFSAGVYSGHRGVSAKQDGIYEADISNISLGFYGGYFSWDREFKAAVGGDFAKYHTKRSLPFIERSAEADFNGNSVRASLEGVYKIEISDRIFFEPFLGLDAANSSYASFKEKGADSLNLNVKKGNYFRSDVSGGAGISGRDSLYGWRVKAEGSLLLAGQTPEIESFFDGDETELSFISRGNEEGIFSFGISAGADLALSNGVKICAGLSFRSSGQITEFSMSAGLVYSFSSAAF